MSRADPPHEFTDTWHRPAALPMFWQRRMTLHQSVWLTIAGGAGMLGVMLLALLNWALLAGLGDERGAAAAQLVAVFAGSGALLLQILLVNLLALGMLGVKIGSEP